MKWMRRARCTRSLQARDVSRTRIPIHQATAPGAGSLRGFYKMKRNLSLALLAVAAAAAASPCLADEDNRDSSVGMQRAQDATGTLGIFNANGKTRTDGPFFQ